MTDNDRRVTGNDIQEGFLYILGYCSSEHLIKMLYIVCYVHSHFTLWDLEVNKIHKGYMKNNRCVMWKAKPQAEKSEIRQVGSASYWWYSYTVSWREK